MEERERVTKRGREGGEREKVERERWKGDDGKRGRE